MTTMGKDMKDDVLNRLKVKRGADLTQSKLTEAQVKEMRTLHSQYRQAIRDLNDEFSARGLAKRYGVHVRTIEKVLSGVSWGHL